MPFKTQKCEHGNTIAHGSRRRRVRSECFHVGPGKTCLRIKLRTNTDGVILDPREANTASILAWYDGPSNALRC